MEQENNLISPLAMTYQREALWGSLLVFCIYKVLVGIVFLLIFSSSFWSSSETVSTSAHVLAIIYLILNCISVGLRIYQRPGFVPQVFFAVLVDIICLTLFIYFDSNAVFECGILISMAIAGASVLMGGRTTVLFAAIATISIFIEAAVYGLNYGFPQADFTQAGMLGLCYFAIAILGHSLSRKIVKNEILASQREKEIINLEQLNEYIIQHMQTGVIALDRDDNIRLLNAAARQLLHWQKEELPAHVGDISPSLEQQFYAWKGFGVMRQEAMKLSNAGVDFTAEFSRVGGDAYRGALIFLHDLSRAAQQAQQMKLALLGQLSASIAHEIRNPLSAISQATQLLVEEEKQLTAENKHLLNIIYKHVQRIDNIVNNVLLLSRRRKHNAEQTSLQETLKEFVNDYKIAKPRNWQLDLQILTTAPILLEINKTQLLEVLANLFDNGLRHSAETTEHYHIAIICGINAENKPYIDVVDDGSGIPEELREKIFEPFFTTQTSGTGLGLYVARELCEANYAKLNYVPTAEDKSCFRIVFFGSAKEE